MLLEPFLAYCTLIFFFLWWCEKLRRVTLTDPSSTNLPYQFFLFFLCPLFTGRGTATSCKGWSVSNPMENLTQNSFLEKYKKKDVGNYNSFFFYSHILGIIDGKKNIREHTYIFSCRALITCSSLIVCNAFTSASTAGDQMWWRSRKNTDDFQIIQMEQWLLWDSFNATQAPPPSLTPSPSLPICSETACSHKLKINCVTERGQLYCSCITYGSVCFSSIFRKKGPSVAEQILCWSGLSGNILQTGALSLLPSYPQWCQQCGNLYGCVVGCLSFSVSSA